MLKNRDKFRIVDARGTEVGEYLGLQRPQETPHLRRPVGAAWSACTSTASAIVSRCFSKSWSAPQAVVTAPGTALADVPRRMKSCRDPCALCPDAPCGRWPRPDGRRDHVDDVEPRRIVVDDRDVSSVAVTIGRYRRRSLRWWTLGDHDDDGYRDVDVVRHQHAVAISGGGSWRRFSSGAPAVAPAERRWQDAASGG